MVTAIVFIKADVARIPEVAEQVAAIEGVSEVYSVTGGLDASSRVSMVSTTTGRLPSGRYVRWPGNGAGDPRRRAHRNRRHGARPAAAALADVHRDDRPDGQAGLSLGT